jgi:hypothetical protein
MRAAGQGDDDLHAEVERERTEGDADDPQRCALAVGLGAASQLPDDEQRGDDLDDGVHAEPGERDRAGADCGRDGPRTPRPSSPA